MKRKHKKEFSKYAKDAVLVTATVCRINFINYEVNGKLKSVFYCPSYEQPEGRMCILWGYTGIQIGDTVQMKGRFNDGVFLAWDLMILARAKDEKTNE